MADGCKDDYLLNLFGVPEAPYMICDVAQMSYFHSSLNRLDKAMLSCPTFQRSTPLRQQRDGVPSRHPHQRRDLTVPEGWHFSI